MPKEYVCELCNKDFSQKIDWERHKAMKKSCLPAEKVIELIKKTQDKEQIKKAPEQIDNKSQLVTFFKSILNFLRDNEHLTGDKALKTIAYTSILRLSEAQIDAGVIDAESTDYYDFDAYEEETINQFKTALRFSVLENRDKMGMVQAVKNLREVILCKHPKFKDFFNKNDDPFRIKSDANFKELLTRFKNFPFESFDHDILGEAYEEVIKDIMVGKVLGQFFTPPALKQFMVELIDPQIKKDGTFETIYDPALGTAGFLLTALRHLTKKAKEKKIKLNEKFLMTKGLGGREAEDDTFRLAKANMLISAGHMFDTIDCDDSIRNPIKGKYDIVLANPPFGIKGLTYKSIPNDGAIKKFDYLPIMSNSAIPLFLQAIIYMLKVNGRAAVVVPNGQDLFNKSNDLVALRELIMKSCDLKEIIIMPADIFNNTGVKTCVFYFEKKKEGKDVLTVKYSKDNSKVMSYDFAKEHQTKSVKFYDYDMVTKEKKLLIEVPIEKIKENSYSLNYMDYTEKKDKEYGNEIEIKTIDEICELLGGKRRLTTEAVDSGDYDFYTCSVQHSLRIDKCDFTNEGIIINAVNGNGKCNVYIGINYCTTSNNIHFKVKNSVSVITKYIYYYLKHNINILEDGFRGANQKKITSEYVKDIKIPFPSSIETQKEIVEKLDLLSENNKTNEKCIQELKKIMKYYVETHTMKQNINIPLGELCDFVAGKYNSQDCKQKGLYPFYNSKADNPVGYYDEYCFDKNEYIILIKDGGGGYQTYGDQIGLGKVFRVKGRTAATSHQYALYIKNDIVINDYLYFYMGYIKNDIMDLAHYTVGLGTIQKGKIEKIKIPILPLEKQKELVAYCNNLTNVIKQLEDQIKSNNELMKEMLENYLQINNDQIDENINDDIIVVNDLEDDVIDELNNEENNGHVEQKVIEKKKNPVIVAAKSKQPLRSNLDRQINIYESIEQTKQSESVDQEVVEDTKLVEQVPETKTVKKVMKTVIKVVAKKKMPTANTFP